MINKMVHLINHLPCVARIFKKTSNYGFFKRGFSISSIKSNGPTNSSGNRRVLAVYTQSITTWNRSPLLSSSYKSSCRGISTDKDCSEAANEKRNLLEIEIELLREEGHLEIPSNITAEDWQQLFDIGSQSGRKNFLRHLFIIEQKKMKRKFESEQVQEIRLDRQKQVEEELLKYDETGLPSYGLWRNSIFMKWDDKRMNYIRSNRVITAALHGQHIVFDNSYNYCMSRMDKKNIAKQFGASINSNREHKDPFYFHVCNFNLKEELSQQMFHYVPTLLDKVYPVEVHEENYLHHFSKDQIVYVTPSAREDITHFDHNAVYVIANLIRQSNNNQVELAKVKKEGIKMQRIPLDKYLDWGMGTKSLPVNIVVNILLDFRHTGSWVKAFDRHIPKRKLFNQDIYEPKQTIKAMSKPEYRKKRLNYDSKKWFE